MSDYQRQYYHGYYKRRKKRANLVLSPAEYLAFSQAAKTAGQSVNQYILTKALEQLQGIPPVSSQWLSWIQTVHRDLYQLGNEIHQLSRIYLEGRDLGFREDIPKILKALFRHLQNLEAQWRALRPKT